MEAKKAAAFRRGIVVLIVLAILTAVEYYVSLSQASMVVMFLIALLKAAAILQYFMHVRKLWSEEGEH